MKLKLIALCLALFCLGTYAEACDCPCTGAKICLCGKDCPCADVPGELEVTPADGDADAAAALAIAKGKSVKQTLQISSAAEKYARACQQARAAGSPVIVWVGCPLRAIDGAVSVALDPAEWSALAGEAVNALVVIGLPGTPQREDVHPVASEMAFLEAVRRVKEPRAPRFAVEQAVSYCTQCSNGTCTVVRMRR